jgi:hypothetical protein
MPAFPNCEFRTNARESESWSLDWDKLWGYQKGAKALLQYDGAHYLLTFGRHSPVLWFGQLVSWSPGIQGYSYDDSELNAEPVWGLVWEYLEKLQALRIMTISGTDSFYWACKPALSCSPYPIIFSKMFPQERIASETACNRNGSQENGSHQMAQGKLTVNCSQNLPHQERLAPELGRRQEHRYVQILKQVRWKRMHLHHPVLLHW